MNVTIGKPEEGERIYMWLEIDNETHHPSVKLLSQFRGCVQLEARFYPSDRNGYLTKQGYFQEK